MLPAQLIKKKRSGLSLNAEEISYLINGYVKGDIPDYQMSSFLMAVFFKGMSEQETLWLTEQMIRSGVTVDYAPDNRLKVDKHSTGGIGDKTSLILAPLVASLGIPVPMISGRGLGHTGGTLDKLESISGFNVNLELNAFKKMVTENNLCFIGQTPDICPADKKLYALRDVTATVESLPLICASIMSKKLAEGIDGLVLDVKFGSGAFMKSIKEAHELATGLMNIAKGAGKRVTALLTNMNQPLGSFAGNGLEINECLSVLKNQPLLDANNQDRSKETRELSLALAAHMVKLVTNDPFKVCLEKCTTALESGQAYEKFEKTVALQGGDLNLIAKPKHQWDVFVPQNTAGGYLSSFDVEALGWINVQLGAGRRQSSDKIEPSAGMQFHAKLGDKIDSQKPIITLYGNDLEKLKTAGSQVTQYIQFSPTPLTTPFQLIQAELS